MFCYVQQLLMQTTPTNLLEIISPIGTDSLLPPHVPDVELVALVLERLDVEAKGGLDGVDIVPVELLDDGGLAGVVEPPVGKDRGKGGEIEWTQKRTEKENNSDAAALLL